MAFVLVGGLGSYRCWGSWALVITIARVAVATTVIGSRWWWWFFLEGISGWRGFIVIWPDVLDSNWWDNGWVGLC